jgi:PAS domain S-box-containing protein
MKKIIITSFLMVFILFFSGILITLYIINKTTSNLDALLTLHKVEIIRQELVITVQEVQSNLYTTGTMFGKELDSIVDNVLKLRERVQTCSDCHHNPPIDQGIEELQQLTEQYKEALSYFMTSTADPKRIARLQVVAAEIGDTIISKSQEMAITANENLRRKTVVALDKVQKSKKILAGTLVFSLFVVILITFFLVRSITRPVSELLTATRKIRQGDLGYTSSYRGKDEFGELIDSFNEMSEILGENNKKILTHMARNQTILQASTDGFVLLGEDGLIIDVNPALCRMAGYGKEELLSMNIHDIEVLEMQDSDESFLKGIKNAGSLMFQADQKRKAGGFVPVEISATYTVMEGRGHYFCFIRDISDRKKMAEELLKAQKLESLGVLAGGIAHDFNNLLTGIMGYIDLAQKSVAPGDRVQGWLESARKASSRAQSLTQQLLTFSKGGEPVKQLVQVKGLLEESTRFVLSGSNVRCEYHLPDNLWLVDADKGQLGQVFQNITLNGAQAMHEGGTITVSAENCIVDEGSVLSLPGGAYVKVVFGDEGVGIAPEDLERIFDPYFSSKHTGSGLGLTICHSIISKHDGLIAVESEPGAGSRFIVYLPAVREGAEEEIRERVSEKRGTGRVLVMDDEEHIRGIVGEMLSYLGYSPDFAEEGAAALEMYTEAKEAGSPYAAVIMDLTIPGGMGGREAVEKLLQFDPEARVIVSSGYSNDPVMAEYAKYGFRGVVSKPFDTEQLSSVLHQIINT